MTIKIGGQNMILKIHLCPHGFIPRFAAIKKLLLDLYIVLINKVMVDSVRKIAKEKLYVMLMMMMNSSIADSKMATSHVLIMIQYLGMEHLDQQDQLDQRG